jgi:DNA adenine methylase
MSGDMPIKAIAPWFGGKRNLAPLIVRELGDHRSYWEPFCGGLPVLMAKPPCAMETVNDLHKMIINLAQVIRHRDQGPMLYRMLRRTLMHEDFFAESDNIIRQIEQGFLPKDAKALPSVMQAYHYFLASWLGRNGTAGLAGSKRGTYCVRYTANGGHAATRWNNAIASIPAWRRRLAKVTILNRDGFDLLERIEDAPHTAIYCDPPYLVKGATYMHDFDTQDHSRLAKALSRFRHARVVVSYYDHPHLQAMYPGWTKVCIEVSKSLGNANIRGGGVSAKAVEVLLINGPSLTQGERGLLLAETGAIVKEHQ